MFGLERIWASLGRRSPSDKNFSDALYALTGLRPRNLEVYRLATRHSSAAQKVKDHNERLEYLGDAVLGCVVAEYLFKKFPYKEEGFLTEIRSRIVNGEHLGTLARKTGLAHLVLHDKRQRGSQLLRSSMHGDAMEALVAAVFLDQGFEKCRSFIINKLLIPHVDVNQLVEMNANFKSQLIEWGQRQGRKVTFDIVQESGVSHHREFLAEVRVEGEVRGTGRGLSKKKAEQAAAEDAMKQIQSGTA